MPIHWHPRAATGRLISERTRDGIAAARKRGRTPGRPPLDPETVSAAEKLIAAGLSPARAAKQLGIGRATAYRIAKALRSSRKEARLTTFRHGGPCGLRTRMRLADRGINPAFLVELGAAGFHGTGLEGGVFQDFSLRSTTASFVYITHSAVVIQFENALLRPRAACRAGTRATPPKTGGSCDTG